MSTKKKPGGMSHPVSLRIPDEYRPRVEAHLERIRVKSAGVSLSYCDALRNLIALGLEASEKRPS